MFILEKKAEPAQQIWTHIKRHYQGEKVAVVGVEKQLPQTFLRNKQVIFYESLTGRSLVEEGKRFLDKFSKDYSAFVFYVDGPKYDFTKWITTFATTVLVPKQGKKGIARAI